MVYTSLCEALDLKFAVADDSPIVATDAFGPPRGYGGGEMTPFGSGNYSESDSDTSAETAENSDDASRESGDSDDDSCYSCESDQENGSGRGSNFEEGERKMLWAFHERCLWQCLFEGPVNACREDIFKVGPLHDTHR